MHHIHLIFTRHKENGACNAYELYRVIDAIKPEIIFEELSYGNYDKSYHSGTLKTLETDAIKMYLKNNSVDHIPVDTFELPKSYDEDVDYMLDIIINNKRIPESFKLRTVIEQQQLLGNLHGFSFLNSNHNNLLFKEINSLIEEIVRIKNEERLTHIHMLQKVVIQQREDEILSNIYNYSKVHHYKKALVFIGAGHRESFLKKIRICKEQQPFLDWLFW